MTTTEPPRARPKAVRGLQAEDVVVHGVAILEAAGMPAEDARLVSESLVTCGDIPRTACAPESAPS
jgi:hypothetical protein